MAERRSVEADVAGSSPVFHPKTMNGDDNRYRRSCF